MAPGTLTHEVVHMNTRRIKCVCGWKYELSGRQLFEGRADAPKDRLLDAFNAHRESGR